MTSIAKRLFFLLLLLTSSQAMCEQATTSTENSSEANRAFTVSSKQSLFNVSAYPRALESIPVNQFHQWVITVTDQNKQAVFPARISIGGGMPLHGHGLPTQPMVTKHLGNGQYLIEGVKFNMDGPWKLLVHIMTPSQQDTAEINLEVHY